MTSTVLDDEVSGLITGGGTERGRRGTASTSRSASAWRARKMSVPGASTAVMMERPWIDCERTMAMPATPLMTSSIGLVTRISTCSGAKPGASVWIETCGGANSGKTSSGAAKRRDVPYTTSTIGEPEDDPRVTDGEANE